LEPRFQSEINTPNYCKLHQAQAKENTMSHSFVYAELTDVIEL